MSASRRTPYADCLRGIPESNRGAVATAFSWCDYDDRKHKNSEFRQWRTNPFADFSTRTLERFELVVLDRVTGRTTSKPAAVQQHEGSRGSVVARAGFPSDGAGQHRGSAPAAGEETVSDDEAARVADALCGPPVDSPTSRAYCRCGCGSRRDPVAVAVERACDGVAPREAVADIAAEFGLDDAEREWVLVQVEDELDEMRRRGRWVL